MGGELMAGKPAGNHRLARTFTRLKELGGKALMPFFVAGDPDLDLTRELCLASAAAGADLLELGLPYSDPLSDGPVIQAAAQRALAGGTTTRKVFGLVSDLRRELDSRGQEVPIVLLSYYNPVFRFGREEFLAAAAAAGIDGLVIPDLPLEESGDLEAVSAAVGLDLIKLLAPTSTDERIRETGRRARGFIYCVPLTGVTGVRDSLSDRGRELVDRVRAYTEVPLLVGFGISNPGQAAEVIRFADGVIVGSALVRMVAERLALGGTREEVRWQIEEHLGEFKKKIS